MPRAPSYKPRRRHVVAAIAYEGLSTFEFGIAPEVQLQLEWYKGG